MPTNIKSAYLKNTRSASGRPGTAYWQNTADYQLDITVDTKKRMLLGKAGIQYQNNSPDTLKAIRVKLQWDIYKKGNARNFPLDANDILDQGVMISNCAFNGRAVADTMLRRFGTFVDIQLTTPLPPRSTGKLSLDWQFLMPKGKIPRGAYMDAGTWFVPYSYPQVAVYDDVHGWAEVSYTGQTEQYNDFSNYDVRITAPPATMVYATGECMNLASILSDPYFQKYQDAMQSENVIHVIQESDYAEKQKIFLTPKKKNTFHFIAKGVPDFAFAFSNHYLLDATSVVVDKSTGRKARVMAVYDKDSPDYYQVCKIARQVIYHLSHQIPGYPYPYPVMTVFNGDDGMEFPMMCNNTSTHPRSPVGLTAHEIAHTYFPFMMGINEQWYAWMDEGWASFFEIPVIDTISPAEKPALRGYNRHAGSDLDIPMITPSHVLQGSAYRGASYNRPQAAYYQLYNMLGRETFLRCMRTYMDTWKSKHPIPWDFFNLWNEVSGKNLNWFWKSWWYEYGFPDLSIAEVQVTGNPFLRIERKGVLPVNIVCEVTYADGSKETLFESAEYWKNQATSWSHALKKGTVPVDIRLGDRFVPDADGTNNVWTGH